MTNRLKLHVKLELFTKSSCKPKYYQIPTSYKNPNNILGIRTNCSSNWTVFSGRRKVVASATKG